MTALITAIYAGYDTLKDPVAQDGVTDYVCVTDDPDLRSDCWRMLVEPRPDVHPNLAAKWPKFLPWRYTDEVASVWIDASHRPTSPRFVAEAVAELDGAHVAQFRHPWRDCIYDEARESITLGKYDGLPLVDQVAHYERRFGHPPHWGLWETGVIARTHDYKAVSLGLDWLHECQRWSFQDQLSEAPLLRHHHLRPAEFPKASRDNDWFAYEPSAAHAA